VLQLGCKLRTLGEYKHSQSCHSRFVVQRNQAGFDIVYTNHNFRLTVNRS